MNYLVELHVMPVYEAYEESMKICTVFGAFVRTRSGADNIPAYDIGIRVRQSKDCSPY